MDPFWQHVDELFHSTLQRPESEREAWLASEAGLDPEIREEVRSLIAADPRHAELSAQTPDAVEDTPDPDGCESESPAAGQRFGPYQTVRLLGCGGMGAVYLARRADG